MALEDDNFSPEEQQIFDQMRADPGAGDQGPGGEALIPPVVEPQPGAGDQAAGQRSGGQQQGAQEQQGQHQNQVPHQALHQERELRKAAERERDEARNRMAVLEDRTTQILQRLNGAGQQQQAPQEVPLPDPATDPVGHILARLQHQDDLLGRLASGADNAQRQISQNDTLSRIRAIADVQETAYERDVQPDYKQAINYLIAFRDRELEHLGVKDPVARQRQIQEEGVYIAGAALRDGENIPDRLYKLAQLRGYQLAPGAGAAPGAGGEEGAGASPSGQQQQQQQQQPGTPTAAEQLRMHQAGQQQARSLGALRGSGTPPLTAQRLYEMSDTDFLKVLDTSEGRELMGH